MDEILDLGGIIAGKGTDDTKYNRGPSWDETGGGGNGDKSGNSSRAEGNGGPLLFEAVIEEDPGESSNRGGEMGNDTS
jgi:hypothetical protein